MKQKVTGLLAFIITTGYVLIQSCRINNKQYGEPVVKEYFNRQTDSLLAQLDELSKAAQGKRPATELKNQFGKARLLYKQTEGITEYYFQGLMKRVNGPALPDVKTEDGQVWPPHGFQVIEQYLYISYHDSLAPVVSNEIKLLQTDLRFIKTSMEQTTILPQHAREIIQHELIRIATQGITGFDAPLSKQSLPEARAALQGVASFSHLYFGETGNDRWGTNFNKCIEYLDRHTDFDSFDRLTFMRHYLAPLSKMLVNEDKKTDTDSLAIKVFDGTLADLLEGNGLNPDYYAGYASATTSAEKTSLGKKLFFDKSLSLSGKISCGSCHQPDKFFTDGKEKAGNLVHGGLLERNTPGLYYASLQSHQFYDLRAVTLEDQANEVMKNHQEFAFSSSGIANKLSRDTGYRNLFFEAFPGIDTIGGYEVRNALAAFVRSLNPFSSRFDEYMQGDNNALSAEEKNGFNLFAGKAKCATCHFVPLFNGNIPPWFTKSESEIIGVPAKPVWRGAVIDRDSGRYRINQLNELLYAFKTPTVRNAAMTAPYMHNGVYGTLDEVVEFYHKGGGVGLGIDLPYQSLPFDSLTLNVNEKRAIVSFMQSLTDKRQVY